MAYKPPYSLKPGMLKLIGQIHNLIGGLLNKSGEKRTTRYTFKS